jgi:nucleoside-diphosphate-sugar epimerase
VTGATGFIGRHLVARLLAGGYSPRALVLPDESTEGLWPGEVEVVRGDIRDPASTDAAVQGAGTVFHLAALVGDWGSRDLFQRVTVDGTRHVLGSAARHNARAVLASSVVFYGADVRSQVCNEDRPAGKILGPYSWSKQQQEVVGHQLEQEAGLQLSIIRPTNVYGVGSGPWVDETVALLKKGMPTLIGGGEQNAGLTHVENVVEIMLLAASSEKAVGRTYNACDGLDVSWKAYFGALAQMVGAPKPRSIPWLVAKSGAYIMESLWKALNRSNRPLLTHEALNLVGSNLRVPNDRARTELGFEPKVRYDEALAGIQSYLNG